MPANMALVYIRRNLSCEIPNFGDNLADIGNEISEEFHETIEEINAKKNRALRRMRRTIHNDIPKNCQEITEDLTDLTNVSRSMVDLTNYTDSLYDAALDAAVEAADEALSQYDSDSEDYSEIEEEEEEENEEETFVEFFRNRVMGQEKPLERESSLMNVLAGNSKDSARGNENILSWSKEEEKSNWTENAMKIFDPSYQKPEPTFGESIQRVIDPTYEKKEPSFGEAIQSSILSVINPAHDDGTAYVESHKKKGKKSKKCMSNPDNEGSPSYSISDSLFKVFDPSHGNSTYVDKTKKKQQQTVKNSVLQVVDPSYDGSCEQKDSDRTTSFLQVLDPSFIDMCSLASPHQKPKTFMRSSEINDKYQEKLYGGKIQSSILQAIDPSRDDERKSVKVPKAKAAHWLPVIDLTNMDLVFSGEGQDEDSTSTYTEETDSMVIKEAESFGSAFQSSVLRVIDLSYDDRIKKDSEQKQIELKKKKKELSIFDQFFGG